MLCALLEQEAGEHPDLREMVDRVRAKTVVADEVAGQRSLPASFLRGCSRPGGRER